MKLDKNLIPGFLREIGKDGDVCISSRIRLARNLENHLFLLKASLKEQEEIIEEIKEVINRLNNFQFYGEEKLDEIFLNYLLERYLVSPDFVLNKNKKGVFIDSEEKISIMVNEEDHLRIQILEGGFSLDEIFVRINELDDKLEKELPYAFSEKFGFLTACPTNLGTGMRATVMLHLPGLILTNEMEKAIKAARSIGFLVRGIYGEGTKTIGSYFQIGNQFTIGMKEEEIVENTKNLIAQIVNYERKARDYLLKNLKNEIEDRVWRAYGILTNAILLNSEEAINLLSTLRLGVCLGIITKISLITINILNILVKRANLIYYLKKKDLNEEERDYRRALLVKKVLKKTDETNE
ncbi:MAG: protein arginine kinase [candidate division WOR-3 bacterium]|nr:protein arginine kinase [candidate division WOR-3 bacterium]MCX7836681.1 protein arginine kinase [candidate division WOR-3 bacterium]MDW8113678.1 protein arginine kinase [candidate division WOR-3 bacterium]